jgi:hypothetical protein
MTAARAAFTATLLLDGRVLAAGGGTTDDVGFLGWSAEVYDLASGSWTGTGRLNHDRRYHTASLLADGKVLVAGGGYGGADHNTSAELFDPATGSWSETGSMAEPRGQHVAAALGDGTVLVAGGSGDDLASAEIYDPITGIWHATGPMNEWRASPSATRLRDGDVLVAGGFGPPSKGVLRSAELYRPSP